MAADHLTSRATAEVVSMGGSIALEILPDRCTARAAGKIGVDLSRESVERLVGPARSARRAVHPPGTCTSPSTS